MTALDGTGLHSIEAFAKRLHATGRKLVICGARRQPAKLIRDSALVKLLGAENIVPDVRAALERAQQLSEGFGGVGEELARELADRPV